MVERRNKITWSDLGPILKVRLSKSANRCHDGTSPKAHWIEPPAVMGPSTKQTAMEGMGRLHVEVLGNDFDHNRARSLADEI